MNKIEILDGNEFKEFIESIFIYARKRYAKDVTNKQLYEDGAIYYMNGNDGTDFDYCLNGRICEFYMFYESENGFIKVTVCNDNIVRGYIYNDNEMFPREKFEFDMKEHAIEFEVEDFAKLMYTIADQENKWDEEINDMDWDVNVYDLREISFYDDEYEEDEYAY